jgi:hypothetical protein
MMGGGSRTVAAVLERFGPAARAAYAPVCAGNGVAWPPRRVYLLAFKGERQMEIWAANARGRYILLDACPILAASGGPGPKRREGDRQVPEGFYRLTTLNPNSAYHLSVRVDYPNREDVAHARVRQGEMGGDIYVHGSSVSVGCLAIGDAAIEKVFCLVALADPDQRRILIAPRDFRRRAGNVPDPGEAWVRDLYARLRQTLRRFPLREGDAAV